jgi:hypothetical protein
MHPNPGAPAASSNPNSPRLSVEDAAELKGIVGLLWGHSSSDKFSKVFLAGW